MNPYQELANAVIETAAKDYRIALMHHFRHPQSADYSIRISEIEHFFRSQWFCALSDLNGEYLLVRIRDMAVKEAHI